VSGIVGLWNLDGRPVHPDELAGMCAALAHRGPDGRGDWIDGPVALAGQLLRVTPESTAEAVPSIDPYLRTVLVWDGRLDNREELLSILTGSSDLSPQSSDPAIVLAAYRAFGDCLPERLSGDFALGLFDSQRRRLLLARDTIGLRPLYYSRVGDAFCFASEIKGLLAHPQVAAGPNEDVLADFLLHGLTATGEENTFFANVYRVLPGEVVTVTERETRRRPYWTFEQRAPVRLRCFEEYVEGFRHYFTNAVRRRCRSASPVAITVSGGLDSSSIFCVAENLRKSNGNGGSHSIGISNSFPAGGPADEQTYLEEIERAYETIIERLPITSPGILMGAEDRTWHVEAPWVDSQANTTAALLSASRRQGARTLLTGHWGDHVLFEQVYLVDLFRRFRWLTIWRHLNEYPRWFTEGRPGVFGRQFLGDLTRAHLPERLVPMLRGIRSRLRRWRAEPHCYTEKVQARARKLVSPVTLADSLSAYRRAVRSNNHILSLESCNKIGAMHGLEFAFPFLDRDLVSYMLAIPGQVAAQNGVPKALLRAALRGVVPQPILERRWKADFTRWVDEGFRREFDQLAQLLESDSKAVQAGYVQGDAIRQELDRSRELLCGKTNVMSKALSRLVGLELWLRAFHNRPLNKPEAPERCTSKPLRASAVRPTCVAPSHSEAPSPMLRRVSWSTETSSA
jgi:asparagine synthase (glutamine-hydrolysing)